MRDNLHYQDTFVVVRSKAANEVAHVAWCHAGRKAVMSEAADRNPRVRLTSASETGRAALATTDAAYYIGLAPATLKKWRVTGDGPPYVKIGTRIVYLVEDLHAWLLAHRIK